jgi:predicted CopG family antitoxin
MMQRKLTITVDERVYEGLYAVVGRRRISRFIQNLVRPHVLFPDLEAAYRVGWRRDSEEAAGGDCQQ